MWYYNHLLGSTLKFVRHKLQIHIKIWFCIKFVMKIFAPRHKADLRVKFYMKMLYFCFLGIMKNYGSVRCSALNWESTRHLNLDVHYMTVIHHGVIRRLSWRFKAGKPHNVSAICGNMCNVGIAWNFLYRRAYPRVAWKVHCVHIR